MQKLGQNSIGVEQGESLLFSDYQHGGQMWTGAGDRERRARRGSARADGRNRNAVPPELAKR